MLRLALLTLMVAVGLGVLGADVAAPRWTTGLLLLSGLCLVLSGLGFWAGTLPRSFRLLLRPVAHRRRPSRSPRSASGWPTGV